MNNIADDLYNAYMEGYEQGSKDSRPTGKWKSFYHGGTSITFQCTACGIGGVLTKTNYCPNCGSRMEVTDNEQTK